MLGHAAALQVCAAAATTRCEPADTSVGWIAEKPWSKAMSLVWAMPSAAAAAVAARAGL